jgi:O-antigen ligase
VDWRGRAVLISICLVAVVMVSNTQAFKERFFFNQEEASLESALTLSGNVNTAGRRELWPILRQKCSSAELTGLGLGSASALSSSFSQGGVDQPHNDYLRIYCDAGLLGTATFWAFFLWAGLRSWRGALTGPDRSLHGAAGQLVLALLLFAITDNPVIYTALFMVPLGVILGLSDRALMQSRMRPGTSVLQDRAGYPSAAQ